MKSVHEIGTCSFDTNCDSKLLLFESRKLFSIILSTPQKNNDASFQN